MSIAEVTLYNGHSSQQSKGTIRYSQDYFLYISSKDDNRQYLLQKTKISPRLGQLPHTLTFPDGSSCVINNLDFVDELIADQYNPGDYNQWIHWLETRLSAGIISTFITVLVVWLGFSSGLPWVAKQAAYALPASVSTQVGEETLALLDKQAFSSSRLDKRTQRRLKTQFFQLKMAINSPNGENIQLNFRQGGRVGANAFALPSGDIIITDELIQLAKNDKEILGVLAHEIGHIDNRHSLRQIIQTTGVTMMFSLALGDVSSIASFAATLPAALVNLKYSREFELEADEYAVQGLQKMGVAPYHYASILERLPRHTKKHKDAFWSSHPETEERVERVRISTQKHRLSKNSPL